LISGACGWFFSAEFPVAIIYCNKEIIKVKILHFQFFINKVSIFKLP